MPARLLLLLACSGVALTAQDDRPIYWFTTIAGVAGMPGSSDGISADARFRSPSSVTVAGDGTLYVADAANGVIRRISAAGVVSTIAGKAGEFGTADGLGANARFGNSSTAIVAPNELRADGFLLSGPDGRMAISLGANDLLYVADTLNGTVRSVGISAPYQVRTIAGRPRFYSHSDGLGTEAFFKTPVGIGCAPDGLVIVADAGDLTVSIVTPEGSATSVAGTFRLTTTATAGLPNPPRPVLETVDGTGSVARFATLRGLGIGPDGTAYLGDFAAIRKMTKDYAVTTLAGTGDLSAGAMASRDGSGADARFNEPQAIAVDSAGFAFVADVIDGRIRHLTPDGVVTTIAGSASGAADGLGTEAKFRRPLGLAVDRNGNLYVADTGNHTIRKGVRVIAPVITVQPTARTVQPGQAATLSVTASSVAPISYQWRRDGSVVPGGTGASLTLTRVQASDAGAYTVELANAAGRVTSATAPLTIGPTDVGPTLTSQPIAQSVRGGEAVTLRAAATGTEVKFQWRRDGVEIPGATNATLTLEAAGAEDAGSYTVVVSNAAGAVTSSAALVTVNTGRIVNLSIRSNLNASVPLLTVGFVVTGGSKPLLLRGVGPALGQFGVQGFVADPRLSLYSGDIVQAANDNWGAEAKAATIAATAARVGAFGFPAASADAALAETLGSGGYSAQISGAGPAGGLVLVELYDANPAIASRLANVSARTVVGTGDDVLVAGFVLGGNAPRTLLIRAVGPTLAAFGVTGVLNDPRIEVLRGTAAVAANDNWGGSAPLKGAFAALGAFPLATDDSRDAAVVVTLEPGSYSVQVSGVGNTTGEALVEIYEVP
jgi:sugar lactone lactonase YvrE